MKFLRINDNLISKLPESFYGLENLETFLIHNNQLKSISPSIKKLKKLEELSLTNNQLQEIPNEISEMDNLKYLLLGDNNISSLPNSLSQLKLKIVEIDNNQFTEFPEVLLKIPTLTKISVKGNKIKNPEKYEKLLTERGIEYIY